MRYTKEIGLSTNGTSTEEFAFKSSNGLKACVKARSIERVNA
jgi:hypothetical protein